MRRILTGFAMAAFIAIVPGLALGGNQEVAEQIARNLRNSGQMSDYKIGVKFQEGTAWVRGRVQDEEQMNTALKIVFKTPGVARIVNELTVASTETAQSDPSDSSEANPLRGQQPQKLSLVKRLESMMQGNSEQENADRVSSSYAPLPVETVSAEETEEAPQPVAVPQRAKPMNKKAYVAQANTRGPVAPNGAPLPMYTAANRGGVAPARYDQPCMPNYAWPSYAAYPNYAAVTYPKQYSATAWPYIGPFYPYPQVPMGWRKVTLEWDDGWWFLDFKDQPASCWHR